MQLEKESWYQFLDEGMQDLVKQAYSLLDREERLSQPNSETSFANTTAPRYHDYSFIVFPMAKAYEGFLKKWFFTNGLIDEQAYRSDHFRIGKSLNPSLPDHLKGSWYVYDQLVAKCSDPRLADELWKAWKEGRNLTFHFFPHHQFFLTLEEAGERVHQLARAMAEAVSATIRR